MVTSCRSSNTSESVISGASSKPTGSQRIKEDANAFPPNFLLAKDIRLLSINSHHRYFWPSRDQNPPDQKLCGQELEAIGPPPSIIEAVMGGCLRLRRGRSASVRSSAGSCRVPHRAGACRNRAGSRSATALDLVRSRASTRATRRAGVAERRMGRIQAEYE